MEMIITLGFIYLYYTTSSLPISLSFAAIGSLLNLIYCYFFNKEKIMQCLAFFVMMIVFGSFSLIFDDPKIYMLKTSFSFIILGVVLFVWPFIMKKTLFDEIVTEKTCTQTTLKVINNTSIITCLLISALNAYVVQNYDMITWGKFKIALGISTAIYLTACFAIISPPWKNTSNGK